MAQSKAYSSAAGGGAALTTSSSYYVGRPMDDRQATTKFGNNFLPMHIFNATGDEDVVNK